jgi:hypothetical protein
LIVAASLAAGTIYCGVFAGRFMLGYIFVNGLALGQRI